jgi:hypothetical protein
VTPAFLPVMWWAQGVSQTCWQHRYPDLVVLTAINLELTAIEIEVVHSQALQKRSRWNDETGSFNSTSFQSTKVDWLQIPVFLSEA